MTRKHFAAIAEAMREARSHSCADDTAGEVLDRVAYLLAERLPQFNPSFDRARFLRACRGES